MADDKRTQKDNPETPEGDNPAPHEQDLPSGCCGGPAPAGTDACCARDAAVKSAGGTGCGCATRSKP